MTGICHSHPETLNAIFIESWVWAKLSLPAITLSTNDEIDTIGFKLFPDMDEKDPSDRLVAVDNIILGIIHNRRNQCYIQISLCTSDVIIYDPGFSDSEYNADFIMCVISNI